MRKLNDIPKQYLEYMNDIDSKKEREQITIKL